MKSHQPAKFVISEKVLELKCHPIYIAVVMDVNQKICKWQKDQIHCSTNASSLLSAFIFPRHFKCYAGSSRHSSFLRKNTPRYVKTESRRRDSWAECIAVCPQTLFLFTSVGEKNALNPARETRRLLYNFSQNFE